MKKPEVLKALKFGFPLAVWVNSTYQAKVLQAEWNYRHWDLVVCHPAGPVFIHKADSRDFEVKQLDYKPDPAYRLSYELIGGGEFDDYLIEEWHYDQLKDGQFSLGLTIREYMGTTTRFQKYMGTTTRFQKLETAWFSVDRFEYVEPFGFAEREVFNSDDAKPVQEEVYSFKTPMKPEW